MPATFLKSVVALDGIPQDDRPHVVTVGRSNVGKSSLINALAGEKNLARVSAEPGRTQSLNFYQWDKTHYLVDLPGYGFARTSKEQRVEFAELILNYLRDCQNIRLVLALIDSRHGATDLDLKMLDILQRAKLPTLIVATKADKLTRQESVLLDRGLTQQFPNVPHVLFSSHEGTGRGTVIDHISRAVR